MTWNPPSDTEIDVDKPIKAVDIRRIRDLSFGWAYESVETTITASAIITFTHGLVSNPHSVGFRLICQTAEHDYSVGDEVFGDVGHFLNPVIIIRDSTTTIKAIFPASMSIPHKTTGSLSNLTFANWKVIVGATV